MQAQLYTICAAETNLTLISLMAGTSMDGIDAALVDITGSGPDARVGFRGFCCYPYPAEVRERLLAVSRGDAPNALAEVSALNFRVGQLLAEAVMRCAADLGVGLGEVDLVASHGQTVYHQGVPTEYAGTQVACTLQIGEAAVIARWTGLPVVSDFRTADIAAGGEGAPLVPYFDYVFLRDPSRARAVQNIGGISNVTYLAPGCELDDVVAFDNGPGNMLIDAVAARFSGGRLSFDIDGAMAAEGRVSEPLLARLLAHPYYAKRPPKTAGREQFGVQYLHQVLGMPEAEGLGSEDLAATLTALTAESVARSYRDFLPGGVHDVIISGGGANNPTLVRMIELATGRKAMGFDEFGIPGDAKEAVAFALLASETARGVPSNVPSATGASRRAILGKITPAAS